jgi:hypothetical protein
LGSIEDDDYRHLDARERTAGSPSSSRSSTPTGDSRSSTPRPRLPPLPETLNQANKILREGGHVNLMDYLEARNVIGRTIDIDGTGPVGMDKHTGGLEPSMYEHLVFPSASAMRRYTMKEGRFASKGLVKNEWLTPLMRDFGFKRSKGGQV